MRVLLLLVISLTAAGFAVGYTVWSDAGRSKESAPGLGLVEIDDPAQLANVQSRPHVIFINTQPGPGTGRVAVVPLDNLDGPRYLSPLRCARVYFAGNTGVCLRATGGLISPYHAATFDRRFVSGPEIALQGYPSRARVAPDGSVAAMTVFVHGHSYASGGLSTSTTLVDVATQRRIVEMESVTAYKQGQPFKAIDFNYWGVTFAPDSDRFYATLSTAGQMWLVEGRVTSREVRLLREGVECPSLSPDGRRIVFKRRTASEAPSWRLHVAGLDAGEAVAIGDERSVDDQAAWLDNDRVLYALRHQDSALAARGVADVWVAPADGSTPPRRFLAAAYSPAVVHSTQLH